MGVTRRSQKGCWAGGITFVRQEAAGAEQIQEYKHNSQPDDVATFATLPGRRDPVRLSTKSYFHHCCRNGKV
jgi:hypothetical protein